MSLESGTRLGRYEIRSKLGAGGMGEVYLAHDPKLDRKVALKILPVDVAVDRSRMNRFVQEAKAASALNHPNIITIYEIDATDSGPFIATEFIDGETLREQIKSTPLKFGEVLDIATQIASALSAAHAVGIVHRDVKPENIMLRRDSIVKVLDFGLAKLTAVESRGVDHEAETRALFKTDPGTVVGTAIYMSPEQARGMEVDARTDIFSLGVLIYELVAGHLPFEGLNVNEIVASILNDKEAQPLARYAREVPPELDRIVEKALRKGRDERYQTAKDMLLDLRRLKQKLEVDRELERSGASNGGMSAASGKTDDARATAVAPERAIPRIEYVARSILRRRRAAAAIVIAIIIISIVATAYYFSLGSKVTLDSIAVLPFENVGNDPNTEYLSDGISEALINSLTELSQVRVIARSTAFRYKGKGVDPQVIGRELNVKAVLMGQVRRNGDTLNIQVDLVDASTGAQVWGNEYERKLSDLVSIKQAIAREVMEKLRFRLSGEEQQKLVKRDTSNAEAYQFYLRGRYLWNKRTADGLNRAIAQFQQSIERDPNYALGYAGLADSYLLLPWFADVSEDEALPKARAAADRAVQIDDTLAEAHTSLAAIYQNLWRWSDAEQEYKRAIALNPNYPTAHQWFAGYLRVMRQFDDSLREVKRAQELDPLSPVIGSQVAEVCLLKNDPGAAIEQCRTTIELDPGFAVAHDNLGWAYLKQGRYEEATAEIQKAVELSGRASRHLGYLGACYAFTGRRVEALAILKELEDRYAKRESLGRPLASVYAALGDNDQAFQWLEKDFRQHSSDLQWIQTEQSFEHLRSDGRYANLVHRMGLDH